MFHAGPEQCLLGSSSTCPSLSGSTHLLAKLPDELPSLADGIGGSEELNGQDRGADSCRYLGRGDRYGGPHLSFLLCGMRYEGAAMRSDGR